MPLFKLKGFAPDADRTTEGVITECENMVPSVRGMKGAPSPQNSGLAALAATPTGSAVLRKLDYTSRFVAGTTTNLYEATTATAWTNVGSSLGAASMDFPWRFSQFGDVSLAINTQQTMVASSAAGSAFVAITAGPIGAIVETVNQFVFVMDTGLGDDYWQCCALGDYTSWAASVTTQAAYGRLTSAPGRITAAKRLGDNIVAYKRSAMYIGQYVGAADNTWAFTEIPGEVGAPSQESIVNVGYAHFFVDGNAQDFYVYDGSRPTPIGAMIREWFFDRVDGQYINRIRAMHDKERSRIYWFFPLAGGSGGLTGSVVLNYKTMQWGCDDRSICLPVEYISAGTTLTGLASLYSTYNDLPSLSYDAPFWTSGSQVAAIFSTGNVVQTLNGASSSCGFTLHDLGDDDRFFLLTGAKPRYLTAPTTGEMMNYYASDLGDTFTLDTTTTEDDSRYDVLRESRWHRLHFDFTGDVELNAVRVDLEDEGTE